jgi:hypothetical protein
MKICPHCKAENEDAYIYCAGCRKSLPRTSQLEMKFSNGINALDRKDYKMALRFFDEIISLNSGNKDALILKGITLMYLKDRKDALDCFKNAGVSIGGGRCHHCGGMKKCNDCGGSGYCYMCNGKGRCFTCKGSGKCLNCGDKEGNVPCKMCGSTKQCPRCKGSGECTYCNGNGSCECAGTGQCTYCGGSGQTMTLSTKDIPEHLRKYLPSELR